MSQQPSRSASPGMPANAAMRGRGGMPPQAASGRGAMMMMMRGNTAAAAPVGRAGGPQPPPGVHLMKGPPPPQQQQQQQFMQGLAGAGRGAALSMRGGAATHSSPGTSSSSFPMGRGGGGPAAAAAMRGGQQAGAGVGQMALAAGRGGVAPPGSAAVLAKQPQQHPPGQPMVKGPPPPGSMGMPMAGKKMMMPPPQQQQPGAPQGSAFGGSRMTSPALSIRSSSPGHPAGMTAGGGVGPSPPPLVQSTPAVNPMQLRPGSSSSGGGGGGGAPAMAYPPPQFAVVNGKKIMVPPGTKLPGPMPPGAQMPGKKMLMGPPGAAHPAGSAGGMQAASPAPTAGVKVQSSPQGAPPQQQQRQPSPSASPFFSPSPPPQRPLEQTGPEQPKKKKTGGLLSGLSGALNLLKLGSDSDAEEEERDRGNAAQLARMQQQQQQIDIARMAHPSPPGGVSPQPGASPMHAQQQQATPPRTAFMVANGKKIMVPPGTKLPLPAPGGPRPQPLVPANASGGAEDSASFSGPARVLSTPPPPGAVKVMHPAGVGGGGMRSGHAAEPPAAQPPHKVLMKAPPGAVLVKKTLSAAPSSLDLARSHGTPEHTPPNSLPGSRSHSVTSALPQPQPAHAGKRMMGPPPPGVKVMATPPHGALPAGVRPSPLHQQPPPPQQQQQQQQRILSPTQQGPSSANMIRVPSSTVLRDGSLPEAGLRSPPAPRRRLGESSDDSDSEREGGAAAASPSQLAEKHVDASADGQDINASPERDVDVVDDGTAEEHNTAEKNADDNATADNAVNHDDTPLHDDNNSSASSVAADAPSAAPASKAMKKKPSAPLPPVRQTAASAALAARNAAAAAKQKEELEKKKKKKEEEEEEERRRKQRRADAEAAQRRRQASLAAERRAHQPAKELPSPQEEDNTQKPTSHDRTDSASIVTTPSRSSSIASAAAGEGEDETKAPVQGSDKKKDLNTGGSRRGRAKSPSPSSAHQTHTSAPASGKKGGESSRQPDSRRRGRGHTAERSRRHRSDDDSDKGSSSSRSNSSSGSQPLTSRQLYRLVNALRDDAKAGKSARTSRHRGRGRSASLRSTGNDSDDWGLRPNAKSSRTAAASHRRGSDGVAAAADSRARRGSLPSSTVGIPWRYAGGGGRVSEPFATPPPIRRPLGYINVGNGQYARVGGSPYAQRRPSSSQRSPHLSAADAKGYDALNSVVPLDISNTAGGGGGRHALTPSPLRTAGMLTANLDRETSAIVDARENALVNEVRADALNRRGSPAATSFSTPQQRQHLQHYQQEQRPIVLVSPIRVASPSRSERALNESASTVDSHHPYCVPASALLPSMQALTPLRRNAKEQPQQLQQQASLSSVNPPNDHQPFGTATPAAAEASREPAAELSAEHSLVHSASAPQQQQQRQGQPLSTTPSASDYHNCDAPKGQKARPSTASSPPTIVRDGNYPSPLSALRRSAFFEQLHRDPNSQRLSSSAIVGGPLNTTTATTITGGGGSQRKAAAAADGWEWGRRRIAATPSGSRVSRDSRSSSAAPCASASLARESAEGGHKEERENGVPSLIPTSTRAETKAEDDETGRRAAAPMTRRSHSAAMRSSPTPRRAAAAAAANGNRATSVGAAVAAAARSSSPRSYHNDYKPDRYRPPSRSKEPVHLTRATIARLSTPQQRRGPSAAAVAALPSPISRRSGSQPGGANSSSAQTCSKWLDEILGATTVTATGVRAGGEGQDAAAAAALPVVDLRTAFKPRIAEGESGIGTHANHHGKKAAAASVAALGEVDGADFTRDFTGSRPRPHVPTISFKHMIGARSQTPRAGDTSTAAAAGGGGGASAAAPSTAAPIREVHGVADGLPFEKYSSIRIHDPTRKSPWALAPEREGLDVLPGRPALARRRRIPDGGAAPAPSMDNDAAAYQKDEDGEGEGFGTSPKKRRGGGGTRTVVVEEVHLDEHRRPYLVVRPVPTGEAAEAQRAAVARLSRPKPIYQRAENS